MDAMCLLGCFALWHLHGGFGLDFDWLRFASCEICKDGLWVGMPLHGSVLVITRPAEHNPPKP